MYSHLSRVLVVERGDQRCYNDDRKDDEDDDHHHHHHHNNNNNNNNNRIGKSPQAESLR